MQHVIRTKKSKAALSELIRGLVKKAVGKDPSDADGLYLRVGAAIANEFFIMVSEAYVTKAAGGTGSDNIRWARNSEKYVAYGKGFKTSRKGNGSMPNNFPGGPLSNGALGRGRGTGELNAEGLRTWWAIYMPLRNHYLSLGMPLREAKARAASQTWTTMKSKGYMTKLEANGKRKLAIGISRGYLQLSLQPGEPTATSPQKPNQLLDVQPGRIAMGTSLSYAPYFHKKRKLWPMRLPAIWNFRIRERVRAVLSEAIIRKVR